jgi:CRISPR/Cas system-associated exonuclease Cas4 (RecB family)
MAEEGDITKEIPKWLRQAAARKFDHANGDSWNISDLYKCERELILKRIYRKPVKNPLLLLHRNYIHDMTIELFKRNGIFVEEGVKNSIESHNIRGEMDLIIKIGRTFYPVEIKSSKAAKHGIPSFHFQQLNSYMAIGNYQTGFIVQFDTIVEDYLDGDCGCQKWELNPEMFSKTLLKVDYLNDCWKHRRIPKKNPAYPKECNYCDYFEECEGIEHDTSGKLRIDKEMPKYVEFTIEPKG